MCKMYGIIENLCDEHGIKPGKMCADLGISRGVIGDLKAGRTKKLSVENIEKIAAYFDVSSDRLLGTEPGKTPVSKSERRINDADLMFALWGDTDEVTEEDLEDVRRYAAFVLERKQKK